jgi:hypothetical protein
MTDQFAEASAIEIRIAAFSPVNGSEIPPERDRSAAIQRAQTVAGPQSLKIGLISNSVHPTREDEKLVGTRTTRPIA